MEVFTSRIKLNDLSMRTMQIIDMINNMSNDGSAPIMVVVEVSPVEDGECVYGKLQFSSNELKVTFSVEAPSAMYLSNFASQFNMCSAHYCDVKFSLEIPNNLSVAYTPPNEYCTKIIKSFFEMTSSKPSVN